MHSVVFLQWSTIVEDLSATFKVASEYFRLRARTPAHFATRSPSRVCHSTTSNNSRSLFEQRWRLGRNIENRLVSTWILWIHTYFVVLWKNILSAWVLGVLDQRNARDWLIVWWMEVLSLSHCLLGQGDLRMGETTAAFHRIGLFSEFQVIMVAIWTTKMVIFWPRSHSIEPCHPIHTNATASYHIQDVVWMGASWIRGMKLRRLVGTGGLFVETMVTVEPWWDSQTEKVWLVLTVLKIEQIIVIHA